MDVIYNLKLSEDGFYKLGSFDALSFIEDKVDICICIEDGSTIEYAYKCIDHFNNIKYNKIFMKDLKNKVNDYFIHMYRKWKSIGIYEEIIYNLKPLKHRYNDCKSLIKYINNLCLVIYHQEDNNIGYTIRFDCPWEVEHQGLIVILNDEVLYVGEDKGLTPYEEKDNYKCDWND